MVRETTSYRPPLLIHQPDALTIYAGAIRPAARAPYAREYLPIGADEHLELDWLRVGSPHLVIVSHGLTGSTRGVHVSRMAVALARRRLDVLAWNFLGAGESINRGVGWYHSGSSDQLRAVVNYALGHPTYRTVSLVGLSLGGNVTLKYLGEEGTAVSRRLARAIVLGAPCDLAGCAVTLAAPRNKIYMRRFLKLLGEKLRAKAALHPTAIDLRGYESIRDFIEYDERYTAPLHGFRSAADYWRGASSLPLLENIAVPTELISARDDPFLSPSSFPVAIAERHPYLTLEIPPAGGHLGFVERFSSFELWSERITAERLAEESGHPQSPTTTERVG